MSGRRYAATTTVPVERSRAEIESVLQRYGASEFASGWSATQAVLGFAAKGRHVRFVLPLPSPDDKRYARDGRGAARSPQSRRRAWDQDVRQRWRALALAIKAKLETVEAGIATFESEFLAYIVIPGGETVGAWMAPQLDEVYRTGRVPRALMAGPEPAQP